MSKSTRKTSDAAFGEFFEKKFRRSPVVIGLSLLVGGFASGFNARSALSHESSATAHYFDLANCSSTQRCASCCVANGASKCRLAE